MEKSIILKAESFKYPNKEERKSIGKLMPKIKRLTIKFKSATLEILNDKDVVSSIRNEDIFWWNNCINNRIGKLTETYIYVLTHYHRVKKAADDRVENRHMFTDKVLFDYYIEIFYYYYFSTRDVIGQLLNLLYDLKIAENKVFLNQTLIDKIQNNKIKQILSDFLLNTYDSYNIRNSFNHRYTPINTDHRAKNNIIEEGNFISFSYAKEVKIDDFVVDMNNLMHHLSNLMNELVNENQILENEQSK